MNWFQNFKRNFCNYDEYLKKIDELERQRDDAVQVSEQFSIENKSLYDKLAFSAGRISKLEEEKDMLTQQGKRVVVVEDSAELPSPLPRLSKNDKVLDEFDLSLEKYYGRDAIMVGVTDTNSMEPLIDYGHTAVILPLTEAEKTKLQVGDIILFHRVSDGSPNVLHRIIEVHDGWVVTRGDNLVESDGFTAYKNIKGYLAAVIY